VAEQRRAEGLLALIGVQLCFGLSPLFAKWALDPLDGFAPRVLVGWRILFGALSFGSLAFLVHGREALPPRAELARLAACALLGVVVNMGLYLEGVQRTSALHAGLLVAQIPVMTYAIAVLARAERARPARVLGIAVALVGSLALVLERTPAARGGGSTLGNLMIVANCTSYAGYLVLARGILRRFPALVVIAWVFAFSLPALPLLFLAGPAVPVGAPPRVLLSAGYTLVFATFAAYLLNAFALARVAASTVAVFIFLQPLVAGAAGVVVLGERITLSVVVAGVLLLAGMVLVVRARPEKNGTSASIQRVAGRVFHSRR
jgi:drug/metabolite transporter (DMT)-like permease